MSEALTKKITPTAAFRAVMAPYRDKIERTDAARGKLEGRQRRVFEQFERDMKEIWGTDAAEEMVNGGSEGEPATP
jgi:hypothetical protein